MYNQILCKLSCHHISCKPFLILQPFLPTCSFLFAVLPVHLPFSALPSFKPHKNYPACFCFLSFLLLAVSASRLIPSGKYFSPYRYWPLHFPAWTSSFQGNFHNLLYEHKDHFHPVPRSLRKRHPKNT